MSGAAPAAVCAPLPPLPGDWQLVTMAALPDGSLGLLGTDVDLADAWARVRRQDIEPLAADSPERPQPVAARGRARLWRFDGVALHAGPTLLLEAPSLALAGFPDGRWLIAATNARDDDRNGRVIAQDGTVLARLRLGDAIEHLATDDAGRIWVGWFDEGIFRNLNRDFLGDPDRSAVVTACFAADGAPLPVGPVPAGAGLLADIDALAVSGDGAWACPYTEFPLLHLRPGEPVRWWRNTIAGAAAIAVEGHHLLLAGGYGAEADRLALLALDGAGEGEPARLCASWRLPLRRVSAPTDYQAWERPTLLVGVGDTLHLVDDGVWHRWRVADLVAAVPEVSG